MQTVASAQFADAEPCESVTMGTQTASWPASMPCSDRRGVSIPGCIESITPVSLSFLPERQQDLKMINSLMDAVLDVANPPGCHPVSQH
jgi:hypothetical protein